MNQDTTDSQKPTIVIHIYREDQEGMMQEVVQMDAESFEIWTSLESRVNKQLATSEGLIAYTQVMCIENLVLNTPIYFAVIQGMVVDSSWHFGVVTLKAQALTPKQKERYGPELRRILKGPLNYL